MSLLRAVLRAFLVQMKLRVIEPFAYLNVIFFPLVVTAIGLFMLSPHTHAERVAYAILGGGLIGFWSVTYLNASNDIDGERWTGTLEQIMGAPTPLVAIVLGKMVSTMVVGLVSFLPTIALAYLGFRRTLPPIDILPFIISLVTTMVAFFSLGMALAPMFTLARWVFPLINGLELLVYVFCGFMFPIGQLPGWVQAVSWFLPPTWSVRSLYAAAGEPVGHNYVAWWSASILLSALYLGLSLLFFRFVERRARVSGQLASA